MKSLTSAVQKYTAQNLNIIIPVPAVPVGDVILLGQLFFLFELTHTSCFRMLLNALNLM